MRHRSVLWAAVLLVAVGCGLRPRAAAADGEALGAPIPLSRCTPVRGPDLPEALRKPGVTGRRCDLRPSLRFFVLSSDPVSWPAVQQGGGPVLSLEHPVAKRLWIAGAGPVGVDFGEAKLVVGRGPRNRPRVAYYSGLADRLDGTDSVEAFVVVGISPRVCLLGVAATEADAQRLALDKGSACWRPVGGR